MLKKISASILLFIVSGIIFVPIVSAHILRSDGSIGAVLHIDPEDDPIAGQQSGFFFEFKDKQNKFTPTNCDCTFSINEQSKEIYSQPLFAGNANPNLENASIFYTFPKKDVYEVAVVGKPIQANAFQPFTLRYDLRVDREVQNGYTSNNIFFSDLEQLNNNLGGHLPHYVGLAIIVIAFLIFLYIDRRNRPKNI